ncbi:MAG TPA: CPBP family glutamic-type intramembrane protease [Actinomycetales bacterium]|nr:CPBP family glutamic-type intramembrane protease [Actinomycetales bacterium]
MPDGRAGVVLLVPVLAPFTMAGVFWWLRRVLPGHVAYNVGFLVYWVGWCAAFPLWVLGRRRVAVLLRTASRPSALDGALLAFPVMGAVATELWPNRRRIDRALATAMVGAGVVNAVTEEVLWHGVFSECFPDDAVRGVVWPLAGFTFWHLAPQIILPARISRGRFLLGALAVGAAGSVVARRQQGLLATTLSHALVDSAGVRANEFRLGRRR